MAAASPSLWSPTRRRTHRNRVRGLDLVWIGVCAVLAGAEPVGAQTGPFVTFFGLYDGSQSLILAEGFTAEGYPIFSSAAGMGFFIIIEGRRGMSGLPVGQSTFDAVLRPDLQVQVSMDLGDGNVEVCGMFGDGIPASGSGDFAPGQSVTDALNDYACRFEVHPSAAESCLVNQLGEGFFAGGPATTTQFCSAPISSALRFLTGDTLVSFRLRDTGGNVGPVRHFVVRVGVVPTPTPTPSGGLSPTRTRTATRTTTVTANTSPPTATSTRSATTSPTPAATFTATRTSTLLLPTTTPTNATQTVPPTAVPTSAPHTPTRIGVSTPHPTPSRCDVNRDGQVDSDDVAAVIAGIFTTPGPDTADLNGQPGVTAADITALFRLRATGCT